MQQRLEKEGSPVRVELYHADMGTAHRHETHLNFLTGSTAVVVATIAFGMGIDKPDTRRVVHYGCKDSKLDTTGDFIKVNQLLPKKKG